MRTAQLALAPVVTAPSVSAVSTPAARVTEPHSHASSAGALHLTRRGRFLLLGLPTLAALAFLILGAMMLATSLLNQAQASSAEAPGVEAQVITVGAGDTLWSVANAVESEERTQVLIGQIAELNDLSSSELSPGQELFVPVD
ncbi:LysM peptidoglycan-binding domain-containing protein [Nesterenkonia sp. Act20]|uniref:LysM peptidoglycan-binding domain-containing protein n=1 Tax=Nesterenkonia sp. Act20 TaxID=1483432 RepID=UPI001C47AC7F|nr:LysM peptidoglycan-binding domain-containing protein [Nesterenkonia sp. Act20]